MTIERRRFRLSPFRAGFTLVELLVVITIIALVFAVAMPSLTGALNTIKRKKVRAALAALESGCRRYKSDLCGNGSYPWLGDDLSINGAEILLKCLTGKGMKDGSNNSLEVPGGGFQILKAGGRVYGPYVDIDTMIIRTSGSSLVFQDAYGYDIGYYAKIGGTFNTVGGGPALNSPETYAGTSVDMFCSSPGPNGTYGTAALGDGYDGDDIVTFVPEE